jgi:hypothetical protein
MQGIKALLILALAGCCDVAQHLVVDWIAVI